MNTVIYNFHPVGQGLFSSGHLFLKNRTEFTWVYDCGSTNLSKAKSAVAACTFPNNNIDLLCISHFDMDHISGITELLAKNSAHLIIMPFVPLWKRLNSAMTCGIDIENPLFLFYVDPIKYLYNINPKIKTFLIVQKHDPNEKLNVEEANRESERSSPDSLTLEFDEESDPTIVTETVNQMSPISGLSNISVLKRDSAICIKNIWEFLPYNDSNYSPSKNLGLEFFVAFYYEELLNTTASIREVALDSIKCLYDFVFEKAFPKKKKSELRNGVSLFLYAGAVAKQTNINNGILHTGDGYLYKIEELNNILNFLGRKRAENIFCLQIMHHGSKYNCNPSVPSKLDPTFSVFCCDSKLKKPGHPDKEVKIIFKKYHTLECNNKARSYITIFP